MIWIPLNNRYRRGTQNMWRDKGNAILLVIFIIIGYDDMTDPLWQPFCYLKNKQETKTAEYYIEATNPLDESDLQLGLIV